jgi:hypothetical protein
MDKSQALVIFGEIMEKVGNYIDIVDITSSSDDYRLRIKGKNMYAEVIKDVAKNYHLKLIKENGLIIC